MNGQTIHGTMIFGDYGVDKPDYSVYRNWKRGGGETISTVNIPEPEPDLMDGIWEQIVELPNGCWLPTVEQKRRSEIKMMLRVRLHIHPIMICLTKGCVNPAHKARRN